MFLKRLSLSLLATALVASPASARIDNAQPTSIYIYGQVLSTAEIYDPKHRCYTQEGQAGIYTRQLCGAINRLMVTDWNNARKSDLVPIPHRGVWGGADGSATTVAENTMAAFQAALDAGYRMIELDAAMVGPPCPVADGGVFIGHYFSMIAAGGPAGQKPCDLDMASVVKFSMRYRNGDVNALPSNALADIQSVIKWARDNQVLLMVDPKVPDLSGQESVQYGKIIYRVLYEAENQGALENIAIKTTYSLSQSIAQMPSKSYDEHFKGKILWSPIVNKSICMTRDACSDADRSAEIAAVTSAAADWRAQTNDSKQIVTFEVALYNSAHWASNAFVANGATYQNLIDFAARQTGNCPAKPALCKRSAIWSVDPASDKGTLSREYAWKFIGNTVGQGAWKDDQRGNPFVTLGYGASTNGTGYGSPLYAAVITDRPDIYAQMQIASSDKPKEGDK